MCIRDRDTPAGNACTGGLSLQRRWVFLGIVTQYRRGAHWAPERLQFLGLYRQKQDAYQCLTLRAANGRPYGNVWKIPYFYSGYGRGTQRMLVYHPAFVTHCQRRLAAKFQFVGLRSFVRELQNVSSSLLNFRYFCSKRTAFWQFFPFIL